MPDNHNLPPPRPPDPYGRNIPSGEGRWRKLAASPFFIVSLLVGGFLLLGVLLVVAVQFRSVSPLVVPGAMRATLPDGTFLWLKLTSGTNHNFSFDFPTADPLWRVLVPTDSRHLSARTSEDRFVIWLMRQDPLTGRPLDFDWWSHASVMDEHGRKVLDDGAYREAFTRYGSRGEGSRRPLGPLEPDDYLGIVARSELPLFRHPGETFTLRIHNADDEIVARFAVPYQLPIQPPKWEPEALPARRSHGDLSVVLQDVEYEEYDLMTNGRTERALRVAPRFDVEYAASPTDAWRVSHSELSDPLGNTCRLWQCDLDQLEPAWRLVATFARTTDAEFRADETWQSGLLEIPETGKHRVLSEVHPLHGATFQLLGIGGSGKTTYRTVDPQQRSGSGSSSGSFRIQDHERVEYEVDLQYRDGAMTVSVDCPLPHLVFSMTGREDDQVLLIRAVTDDGRQVPTHHNTSVADLHFVFFEVPVDTLHLDVAIIVHGTIDFEFFLKPPARDSSAGSDP